MVASRASATKPKGEVSNHERLFLVLVNESCLLKQQLFDLMKAGKDTIIVYTLCKPCVNKRVSLKKPGSGKKVVNVL